MGVVTVPIAYLPYALIVLDLIMGGPRAAAQSVSGVVVGHLWWWLVWGGGLVAGSRAATAPRWLRRIFGSGAGPSGSTSVAGSVAGVHVIPPRRPEQSPTSGHQWGAGHRLGGS
jgi:Derlin-2/3